MYMPPLCAMRRLYQSDTLLSPSDRMHGVLCLQPLSMCVFSCCVPCADRIEAIRREMARVGFRPGSEQAADDVLVTELLGQGTVSMAPVRFPLVTHVFCSKLSIAASC